MVSTSHLTYFFNMSNLISTHPHLIAPFTGPLFPTQLHRPKLAVHLGLPWGRSLIISVLVRRRLSWELTGFRVEFSAAISPGVACWLSTTRILVPGLFWPLHERPFVTLPTKQPQDVVADVRTGVYSFEG